MNKDTGALEINPTDLTNKDQEEIVFGYVKLFNGFWMVVKDHVRKRTGAQLG